MTNAERIRWPRQGGDEMNLNGFQRIALRRKDAPYISMTGRGRVRTNLVTRIGKDSWCDSRDVEFYKSPDGKLLVAHFIKWQQGEDRTSVRCLRADDLFNAIPSLLEEVMAPLEQGLKVKLYGSEDGDDVVFRLSEAEYSRTSSKGGASTEG